MVLSRFNVFIVLGTTVVTLIVGTIILIAYTPLREYVPGYASTELRRSAVHLEHQTDSLIQHMSYHEAYVQHLQSMIRGEVPDSMPSAAAPPVGWSAENLQAGQDEIALRDEIHALEAAARAGDSGVYLPPLSPEYYNASASQNYRNGVLFDAPVGTEVVAIRPGTLVAIEGSAALGYSLWLQHNKGALSRYSNLNAAPDLRVGDFVKAGEALTKITEPIYLNDIDDDNPLDSNFRQVVRVEYWVDGRPIEIDELLNL